MQSSDSGDTEGNHLDKASTRRKSALRRGEKVTWQKCIAFGTQMSVVKPASVSYINLDTSIGSLIDFRMTIKKVYAIFHVTILPFFFFLIRIYFAVKFSKFQMKYTKTNFTAEITPISSQTISHY